MLKENYNFVEKLLHYLILDNNIVGEFLFDIEKKFFLNNRSVQNNEHIFICGLARSGSTLLLNIIYQDEKFCSLTYKDMPMILGPNIWSKYFGKNVKNSKDQKRAHDDLIKINLNSPEAFEEVFWKLMLKSKYISNDFILDAKISEIDLIQYSNFISLICSRNNKSNYLSKNNNSIFRIDILLEYFQKSFFIIPYRNPYDHAFSLMHQHQKFSILQKNNQFIKKYMNWLGHYEFGLIHKRFKFEKSDIKFDINTNDYWLHTWIEYYQKILDTFENSEYRDRIILLNYDKLCKYKYDYLGNVLKKINFQNINKSIHITKINKDLEIDYNKEILDKAIQIYDKLNDISNYN